jgi:chromosome segregation ATPase
MGFFTKDKKEEKTIEVNQRASTLPELPEIKNLPELPKLPELQNNESSETEEIKRGITGDFEKRTIELNTGELKKYSQTKPVLSTPINSQPSKNPIYIKIDKFQEALKKFEEVKSKLGEIENTLENLKETKQKEEQEIAEWENEVKSIKEKVSTIDASIFSSI